MKLVLILNLVLILTATNAYANEKYSYKDFMHQDFLSVDASEFSDSTIIGSNFYQESAYSADALGNTPPDPLVDVFPVGTQNVTFERCNLDNVKLPKDSILIDCINRRIRVQNDWEDWILDGDSKPSEPMNLEQRLEAEVWTSPNSIPNVLWTEAQKETFEEGLRENIISP